MRKSWHLTKKILSGQKKIESRWYKVKCHPWDEIKKGEIVYFKDSGEPVMLKAEVDKVIQYSGLTHRKVGEIVKQHGKNIGLEKEKNQEFFERFKDKKYCVLVFLKNQIEIEPFEIDKTGFGAMAAWISISNISKIKK